MIVGLTGGIGSGKTWVSSLFKDLGIPVYISDVEAKKIMNSDIIVKKSIIELFGSDAYEKNQLNRKLLSEKVFADKSLLEQLNAIVHPAVRLHFEYWYKKQNSPFVIKESAIIFELGNEKQCDAVILVTAPKELRIRRVKKRDSISEAAIELRMDNQWGDNKKVFLADYVIENIEKKETILKVDRIYNHLLKMKSKC